MILQPPIDAKPAPVVLATPDYPFWGFAEVLLTAAIFIPALLTGSVITNSIARTFRSPLPMGISSLLAEAIAYVIVFGAIWVMFQRYGRDLFSSLGWVPSPFSAAALVWTGVGLAVAVVVLSVVLQTPTVPTPFQKLLSDRATRIAIGLFGVTVGPVVEELLFRGLLQPFLMRLAGVLPGIVITAALFGSLHLQQYGFIWQSGFLVTLVGFVLGAVRHVSGSTRASALVHISYNAVFSLSLLAAGDQISK